MASILISRRVLACRLAMLPTGLVATARVWGASNSADYLKAQLADGLTHTSEAIHQEIMFKAERRAVYEALTNARQFDAITRLSDALALVTAPHAQPTSISPTMGGAFTLFGGYITGLNLELVPDERLIQAWRVGNWDAGAYSIAQFALVANGAGSKLVFDHGGFPQGAGKHLASGWHSHYWEPLAKFLSKN